MSSLDNIVDLNHILKEYEVLKENSFWQDSGNGEVGDVVFLKDVVTFLEKIGIKDPLNRMTAVYTCNDIENNRWKENESNNRA